jgi:hypothetical protein
MTQHYRMNPIWALPCVMWPLRSPPHPPFSSTAQAKPDALAASAWQEQLADSLARAAGLNAHRNDDDGDNDIV